MLGKTSSPEPLSTKNMSQRVSLLPEFYFDDEDNDELLTEGHLDLEQEVQKLRLKSSLASNSSEEDKDELCQLQEAVPESLATSESGPGAGQTMQPNPEF